MSSFGIYIIGYVIVVIGVAVGANLLGLPPRWIAVGVIIMVGIGVVTGVSRTKRPDPPSTS